jgi:short-subunit dehydrogenase
MNRVFITGASSGIGAALAAEYARRGATLGLLARRRDALEALAAGLPNNTRHRIYSVDVSDHAALAAAAQDFISHEGGADIVIASAGVSGGTLIDHPEDMAVLETIFAINVNATAATFMPFVAAMKNQDTPCRLVGIASVAGIRGLPGASAYSASKAAVIAYCESLRIELKVYGIDVVTIAPGFIATPMTANNKYPMPFLMRPERFAASAARAIARGSSYAVIPWQMGVVAKLMRLLPNFIYDAAFARAPKKARSAGERA